MVFADEPSSHKPKHIIRDRDSKFTRQFCSILEDDGIEFKVISPRAPDMNPFAEAWVQRTKHEPPMPPIMPPSALPRMPSAVFSAKVFAPTSSLGPTVIGRAGVHETMEIELWPKEVQGLRSSGAALRKTLQDVLPRIQ